MFSNIVSADGEKVNRRISICAYCSEKAEPCGVSAVLQGAKNCGNGFDKSGSAEMKKRPPVDTGGCF
jgi:hypothetical protein